MSDEEALSKRERQKARKRAKREVEQKEAAKARRRRLMAYTGVGLLVLGLIGFVAGRQIMERREAAQLAAEVEARLDEVGCTPIEEMPDQGAGHFGSTEELAQSPPDLIYEERPAASGPHMGQVALTGVYDAEVDERVLLHNLEHGYVVFWYDEEADDEQVEELKQWSQEQIDDGFRSIITAQYHEPLPVEGNFAAVAWDHRQVCEQFDADVFEVFLDERHESPDVPEPLAGPHDDPGEQGVLNPAEDEEGRLLYPPLGDDDFQAPDIMDDPAAEDEPLGPVADDDAADG